jgi:uncharacterized protein YndB with AHSA1/START domain
MAQHFFISTSKHLIMRFLRKILIGLGILLAIVLVSALFMKKDYAVEREIVINKPIDQVFSYLTSLQNQSNWSTWVLQDPKIKLSYTGEQGTVGSTIVWASEMMGNGEQEVKKIDQGKRIDFELRFKEPMASVSPAYITTDAVSETQTKVKWGMSGHMSYPFNFMQVFMDMNKVIGTEYQNSLTNLKKILEQ